MLTTFVAGHVSPGSSSENSFLLLTLLPLVFAPIISDFVTVKML